MTSVAVSNNISSSEDFRVKVYCVVANGKPVWLNIRCSDMDTINIQNAFGIPDGVRFFLKDKHGNAEFPDRAKDHSFKVDANVEYHVQFTRRMSPTQFHSPAQQPHTSVIRNNNRNQKRNNNNNNRTALLAEAPEVEEEENKTSVVNGEAEDSEPVLVSPAVPNDSQIDWRCCKLLDLSNGEGGKAGSKNYVTDHCTVRSSVPTHNNSSYYYMQYLFNGNSGSIANDNYWLCSAGTKNETLTFAFAEAMNISHINVCATSGKSNNAQTDRTTHYSIDGKCADSGEWIQICGMIDTSADSATDVRGHNVLKTMTKIRFNLEKQKTHITLKEIDIYVV